LCNGGRDFELDGSNMLVASWSFVVPLWPVVTSYLVLPLSPLAAPERARYRVPLPLPLWGILGASGMDAMV
jgi:hypothetical protein